MYNVTFIFIVQCFCLQGKPSEVSRYTKYSYLGSDLKHKQLLHFAAFSGGTKAELMQYKYFF